MQHRVQVCQNLLNQDQNDPDFLLWIVTTDESCLHFFDPETKAQSGQWKRHDEASPLKAAAVPSAGKRMATVLVKMITEIILR